MHALTLRHCLLAPGYSSHIVSASDLSYYIQRVYLFYFLVLINFLSCVLFLFAFAVCGYISIVRCINIYYYTIFSWKRRIHVSSPSIFECKKESRFAYDTQVSWHAAVDDHPLTLYIIQHVRSSVIQARGGAWNIQPNACAPLLSLHKHLKNVRQVC